MKLNASAKSKEIEKPPRVKIVAQNLNSPAQVVQNLGTAALKSRSKLKVNIRKPKHVNISEQRVSAEMGIKSIPNYSAMSRNDQSHYRNIFLGQFSAMERNHGVKIQEETLNNMTLEQLNILYNDYLREIEIASISDTYGGYLMGIVAVVELGGFLAGLNTKGLYETQKKNFGKYKPILHNLAVEKYESVSIPNPMNDLIKLAGLSIMIFITGSVIETSVGAVPALAFKSLTEVFLGTTVPNAPKPAAIQGGFNIKDVPTKPKSNISQVNDIYSGVSMFT